MTVTTISTHTLSGKIGLEFQGTTIYLPLRNNSDSACAYLMSNQGKYGTVKCDYQFVSHTLAHFTFTFLSWPTHPKDTNFYTNNGNPASTDFLCDASYASAATWCIFEDIVTENIQGTVNS